MRKLFKTVVCLLCAATCIFGFVACGKSASAGFGAVPADGAVVTSGGSAAAEESDAQAGALVRDNRFVGVTYSTWFPPFTGDKWGTPVLGEYTSTNRDVIRKHAEWLVYAGVDFIVIDWTNNIDHVWGDTSQADKYAIENATQAVYEVFAEMEKAPKIVIAGGVDTPDKCIAFADGRMQRRVDEIWENFYGKPEYEKLNFIYKGKPLLMAYLGTAAGANKPSEQVFKDSQNRVTMRFFTGFLSDQPNLLKPETNISKNGYWSWWDRGHHAYAVGDDGTPECITVSAAWVGSSPNPADPNQGWLEANGGMGRKDGATFAEQWDNAIAADPEIILVQSFNEWTQEWYYGKASEEWTPEYSNDIEPSKELGYKYLNMVKEKGYLFKKGKTA